MKFISRYVDLPKDLTYDQIAYDLTMRTVEVEEVIKTADKFHDIVVGEIKEVRPHPNADALKICMTDVGEDEIKQIVCGGSNLTAGHKVCVSKPGAEVVWHGEGEPVLIKESKLRGEKSYGMICSPLCLRYPQYISLRAGRRIRKCAISSPLRFAWGLA